MPDDECLMLNAWCMESCMLLLNGMLNVVEKYKNKFDCGSVYVSQHVGQRTHSLTSKEDEFNQFIRWSGDSSLIEW